MCPCKMVEDTKMSTVYLRQKSSEKFLKMNGINAKLFDPGDENQNCAYPPDTAPLENQVAGHTFGDGKSTVGMLKHKDGYVLKPIEKPVQGEREVKFYEDIQKVTDPVSVVFRSFIPEYHGTTVQRINEKDIKFIILQNATHGCSEPCIMDIKIGRQTWDPDATNEKIEGESKKYAECKRDVGFCIPGFQVYRITTGKVMKFGKDYGKRLNKTTVRDALKVFLNADSGLSRELMFQLLARLWRILCWCRSQRKFRIYSSSLLLVYDAKKLRQSLKSENKNRPLPISKPAKQLTLKIDTACTNGGPLSLGFATPQSPDQLSPTGTIIEKPRTSVNSSAGSLSPVVPSTPTTQPSLSRQTSFFGENSWHPVYDKIRRTHSFINNYEKELQSMKEDYSFQLDDLISADQPGGKDVWATVKMIDFAHVFPSSSEELDTNYLEGIENLVKIFESLVEEAV